jgi:alpha-tubulin suppressor-like RCC1 family protein
MQAEKPKIYKLQAVGSNESIRLNAVLLPYFRTLKVMITDLVEGDDNPIIQLIEFISAPVMQWLIDVLTIVLTKKKDIPLPIVYESATEYNRLLFLEDPERPPLLSYKGVKSLDPIDNLDSLIEIIQAINWLDVPLLMIIARTHLSALLSSMPSQELEALALSVGLSQTPKRKRTDESTGLPYTLEYLRSIWLYDYARAVLPAEVISGEVPFSRKYLNPIAAGAAHQLFIAANGSLYGMGKNDLGQLGLGDDQVSSEPHLYRKITTIPGKALLIACKYNTSLCYTTEGLYGCGVNDDGQLGLGPRANNLIRVWTKIDIPSEVLLMAIGRTHIVLLTVDGIYASGNNAYGQLGLADTVNRSVFTRLTKPTQCVSLDCGDGYTVFNMVRTLLGCGTNARLQIGSLPNPTLSPTRFFIQSIGRIPGISCGVEHTIFIANNTLLVTGGNTYGQLGRGAINTPGLEGVPLEVYCGPYYTLCVTTIGVYTAGKNDAGQLGVNDKVNKLRFTKVVGLEGEFISAACGADQLFVFTSEGLYQAGRFDYVLSTETFSGIESMSFQKWPIDLGYRKTIVILDDATDTLAEEEPAQKKIKLECEYCGYQAHFLSQEHQLPFCNKLCLYEYTEHQ